MSLKGYVTAEEVISLMAFPDTPVVLADVEEHLAVCEALVEQYCRTRFDAQTDVSRTFSGDDSCVLALGYFLKTLTKVEILDEEGTAIEDITASVVTCPDEPLGERYRWLEIRKAATISSLTGWRDVFPAGNKNVRVTGDWGWDVSTELPPQIKQAVAMTVKMFFDLRIINEFILTDAGGGRIIQLPDPDKADVSKYLPFVARAMLRGFRNSRWFS